MKTDSLVSICVPSYERPKMMRDLIASVTRQTHRPIELVISDDSVTDDVERAVREAPHDITISYSRNSPGLGYAANLRKAILSAHGDLIIVLGDDDFFADADAIRVYLDAFIRHPSVGYAYSNQAQVSAENTVDKILRFFPVDTEYRAGAEAIRAVWTTSIFIPGMAFRNSARLAEWYPKETMLFPQMQLVGNIIARQDAMGISNILIAGRAHAEQLGFYAIKGDRIVGGERHGVLESRDILESLIKKYELPLTPAFLERQMIESFSVSVLKEALVVGKRLARNNCESFMAVSEAARRSRRLRMAYLLLRIAPLWVLRCMRSASLALERLRDGAEYAHVAANVRCMAETITNA